MTKKIFGFVIASAAIVLCVLIAVNWETSRPYRWKSVDSQDGQFRMMFPQKPTASQENDTAPDGSRFVLNRLTSTPAREVTYTLTWWENPTQKNKTTEQLFADFRDCYISSFHGKSEERQLNVQGYPAEQTVVFASNGSVVENLVIRVGPRLYSLWVLDSTGHLDIANVKEFFNSVSFHGT